VLGSAQHQRLYQSDPQHHARLGIIGQPLLGRPVDQIIKVWNMAQRFRRDGMRQSPVCWVIYTPCGRGKRLFQRLPPAENGIEKLERSAPSGKSLNISHPLP
jgi:hypothetical protein